MTNPESPTATEMLARAHDIVPVLARNAAQGEQDRCLAGEVVKSLSESGMFKLLVPRRHGGYELPLRTFLDITSVLAEGDGGSSWLVSICNSCAWMASLFPERAQNEVFGKTPGAIVSGVVSPSAQTRKVDGGFRVTGRWHYNSGSWHADWAVVGVPITDSAGEVVDQGMALLPASEYSVEETWFVAGMCSTGSNCLVTEDVFIPDHRVVSVPPLIAGTHPAQQTEEPLYRSPFASFVSTVVVGPQLGLARSALRLVTDAATDKGIAFTFFEKQYESTAFQLAVANAALKIDTAHLHAYRAADAVDVAAVRAEPPDYLTRARIRADLGHVAENVVDAINILLHAHGSGGFANSNPLQRIWRDANVAARHAVIQPAVGKEAYGKALLGIDEKITPML